ncbi:MAG TPA: 2-oxoglutarate dehydrogenase E1 component [Vicinamibacterales bacterium]|nr:2-oxoglutarate dehydrogenase E1 component [Vicinamibacterales bacterium]
MTLGPFGGVNSGYVLELYERYRQNPDSVDPETRKAFESWAPIDIDATPSAGGQATTDVHVIVGAANLAESIRRYGHLAAQLDPLGSAPIGDPSLSPGAHGITDDDLKKLPASLVGGPVAESSSNAFAAIETLRRVYCSTTGFDYSHVFVPEERVWLRHAVESGRFLPHMDPSSMEALLDRITQVEVFEKFLHRTFPGKTRFSIEGVDMLVPILDAIIAGAANQGARHTIMGMAHRGRLNVLAHILEKPYTQILAEFKDPVAARTLRIDLGWMGDVKYHAGASTTAPHGQTYVTMPPNPSHLEAVDPVVVGMARAAGTDTDAAGPPRFDGAITLPILIHGDASFPGQGIVAETLNLSRLAGYDTAGTIHIIANNQLGFTATPDESYSTSYASGLARGFKIPIVHVNADDPVACLEAARLAWEYRARFHLDFLIDLIGYRRFGHNEGDEPAFTQPLMYKAVATHPTVRQIFATLLAEKGAIARDTADALVKKYFTVLEKALASLEPEEDYVAPVSEPAPPGVAAKTETAVPVSRLREINAGLLAAPPGFTFHKKLERGRERRKELLTNPLERTIDWAAAEELAFATILAEGIPIRLTGEDVERGTFSHRHAVFHDSENGQRFVPLQSFAQARAAFEIHNSPLSENGTVGFEFGYNIQEPGRLVVWEAQYGDFINGAQVILDQFVTSARAKWGLQPSLVFLLPHGYEGQGPEHSSARPERILQAAANINLRLVNCTTAAQYFHLLRRQARLLTRDPLPLFVLTPKSLLRNPIIASAAVELEEGRFQSVLNDEEARGRANGVRRIVLCSGKVYVDLLGSEHRKSSTDVAICRVEQLAPFPSVALRAVLDDYPEVRDIVWLQEEPENVGAWDFMRPLLEELIGDRCPLRYVGRARSASPSEGSSAWHQLNQRAIVERAFDLDSHATASPEVLSKPARSLTGSKR